VQETAGRDRSAGLPRFRRPAPVLITRPGVLAPTESRRGRMNRDDRIAGLFRKGWTLDLICELGVTYGWTRRDVQAVVTRQSWELDWSGRLSQLDRYQERFAIVPEKKPARVLPPDTERMIEEALHHESHAIRQQAMRAADAVHRLACVLGERVRRDELQARHEAEAKRQKGHSRPPRAPGQDQQGFPVSSHPPEPPRGAQPVKRSAY
jgi:hypothetical protein